MRFRGVHPGLSSNSNSQIRYSSYMIKALIFDCAGPAFGQRQVEEQLMTIGVSEWFQAGVMAHNLSANSPRKGCSDLIHGIVSPQRTMMDTKRDYNSSPYSVSRKTVGALGDSPRRGTFVELFATSLLLVSTFFYLFAFWNCRCDLGPCLLAPVVWPTYWLSLKLVDCLFSRERRTSLAFWLFYFLWHLFLVIDGKGSQPSPTPFFKECMDFHCRFGCFASATVACEALAERVISWVRQRNR